MTLHVLGGGPTIREGGGVWRRGRPRPSLEASTMVSAWTGTRTGPLSGMMALAALAGASG